MWNSKPPILIAEDDSNDVHLFNRTLKKIGINSPVQIVEDGEEAMCYLRGEGRYADRGIYPFPSMVITDIKMPRKNGFDVLMWLKRHPECSIIPIIVWTSSNQECDILKAYQLGANCYLQKPHSATDWCDTIALIFKFWEICEKPSVQLAKCAETASPAAV
ncbi:MAG: response regulator [Verrucomicrobiota bacterium]